VVLAGFGAPDETEKRDGARAYAARRGAMIIWTRIPPSFEAVIKHARTPRGLMAACYAAKSRTA
jgi:hypothetical protein